MCEETRQVPIYHPPWVLDHLGVTTTLDSTALAVS